MNAPSLTVPPPRVSAPLLCLLLPTPQVVASGNPNGPNGGPCGPGATDAAAVTRNEFVSVGGGLGVAKDKVYATSDRPPAPHTQPNRARLHGQR